MPICPIEEKCIESLAPMNDNYKWSITYSELICYILLFYYSNILQLGDIKEIDDALSETHISGINKITKPHRDLL